MRLYLSSYKFGNNPERLFQLLGGEKPKVAIVTNAADVWSEEGILKKFEEDLSVFKEHGLTTERLDLRDYFGKNDELQKKMEEFGMFWVRGGNVFILRKAMQYSGFDKAIKAMLNKDSVVYGGYSAGSCVLSPSLRGIELCDDKDAVVEGYNSEVLWNGLNIIPYSIAPHFKSDHPESSMVDNVVEYMKEASMAYKTLHDGEAIVINGDREELVT